jgi:predicted TIM-barrel fold metal-dependent hydrolase
LSNEYNLDAIDTVVNLQTPEILKLRSSQPNFLLEKFGQEEKALEGWSVEEMLALMDEASISRAFLVACKVGQIGLPGSWHLPYEMVADAIQAHPDRFYGLAGIDPTEGMNGVRELENAVRQYGFIGAHGYPQWFELAPDHAKWYPFYSKCVELDIPIQLQVGQSLVYHEKRPLRSVGRPITLDSVACDFPELKLIGIHVGIPWTDEMIAMAWKHKNVYIISDAHAPRYWPTSFVNYINTYGRHKVMFGTDFPVLGFDRMRREVEELGLREESLKLFLRDNAIKIYKLDEIKNDG